jgi:tyrosine-protein phosphatase SIW14
MSNSIDSRRTTHGSRLHIRLLSLTIITLSFAAATFAQISHEQVEGVKNFGRVTDRYFRGGQVTEIGVDRLARMGVRTIIDLRDKPSPGEPEACERNGIKYFKFPMDGHVTPDDKAVTEILSIIQGAKEPVYVHCSAGKHRTGTIAALYRMRVQGWSRERAWAEQQSYGFGSVGEHPELYAYVYGDTKGSADASLAHASAKSEDADNKNEKSSKSKKDKEKDKRSDSDKAEDEKVSAANENAVGENAVSEIASRSASSPAGGRLSADASYIAVTDAIKRAKAEGASGDLLKIDLEWDAARSVATWDMTFSSGTEYEFDATTGKLLGTKPKAAAKLALLSPLELDGAAKKLLMFQQIIQKAEKSQGQPVVEMELKRIKGRSQTIFEVGLTNGATVYYDAVTGEAIATI